jgi:hypothetical protein
MKNRKFLYALMAAATSFALVSANAMSDAQAKALTKSFANVPIAEMSAKAATTVAKASAKDKAPTAVLVVKTVLSRHPAMVAPLVASIVTAVPQTAVATATAAAKLVPDQATLIALTAAQAAPEFAAKIAAAVGKTVPAKATEIASLLIHQFPKSAEEIAQAVVSAVPLVTQQMVKANPIQSHRTQLSSADNPFIGGNINVLLIYQSESFQQLLTYLGLPDYTAYLNFLTPTPGSILGAYQFRPYAIP